MSEITAKTRTPIDRISQCDIFEDMTIVENVKILEGELELQTIKFPYLICLNQDCDLNSDYRSKTMQPVKKKNCRLTHLLVAPLFLFDLFKDGKHWGEIFDQGESYLPKNTNGKKVMNNEDPRYHFLRFDEGSKLPDMVIDFKHFFTVSTTLMYDNLSHRIASIDELYREKICQRFAFFQSRIGLPD